MSLPMIDFYLDPDPYYFPESECYACGEMMDYHPRQVLFICPTCGLAEVSCDDID